MAGGVFPSFLHFIFIGTFPSLFPGGGGEEERVFQDAKPHGLVSLSEWGARPPALGDAWAVHGEVDLASSTSPSPGSAAATPGW